MENSEKLIIAIGIIFAILFIAGAIIVKASVPSYSLAKLIITIAIIILFFGTILTIWHFISKGKQGKIQEDLNKKKQPDPIDESEALRMALEATENEIYSDYIRFNVLNHGVEELGKGIKSQVFWLEAEGKYTRKNYFVVINMHFPGKKKCVLINASDVQKLRAKMLCSTFPEDEPNVRTITNENVVSGIRQTISEKIKEKDKEEPKQESSKKEEL